MEYADLIMGVGSILVGLATLAAAAFNALPGSRSAKVSPTSPRRFLYAVGGGILIVVGALILAGFAPFASG